MIENNKIQNELINFSELIHIPVIISNSSNPPDILHINSAGEQLAEELFSSTPEFTSQVSSFSGLLKKIITGNQLESIYNDISKIKDNRENYFITFTSDENKLYSMILKISVYTDLINQNEYIVTVINNISELFNYRAELYYSRKYLEGFIEAFAKDRMTYLLAYGQEETVKHLMEVREFSKLIAQKIMQISYAQNKEILEYTKITPLYIKILEVSALLHDFGKIHSEINQLIKLPRKLTLEEYEKVKEHAVIGSELIGDSEILRMCQLVARFHHEKWDGSGYPDGLKENDIPLSARIVAFADMFSALRAQRAYKQAITDTDEIIKIFYECEKFYDPLIFKTGMELIPEMIDITCRLEEQYNNFRITSEFFIDFLKGIVTV